MSGSGILQVTGGSAGVAAELLAVRRLGEAFDVAGDRLRAWSRDGLAMTVDVDLVASGLLSPGTCAVAEAAVVAASCGPRGALPAAAIWEVDARAVRSALTLLEVADDQVRRTLGQLDTLLLLSPFGLGAVAVAVRTRQPALVQHLVNGAGGPATAGLVGGSYGGPGRVRVTPYATRVTERTPGSVRDLLAHLRRVALLSPTPTSAGNGTVEVQSIQDPRGTRHIVYLPGTDRFNAPWDQTDDVRDLETDLDLMDGEPDGYTTGVLQAMRDAGVGPEDPVLLVGHSAGGMAAAALVSRAAGFRFVGAVTAGAPTAQVPGFPAGTEVLSLEQRGDLVPLLDGADNPDSVEQTTVTFDAHPGDGVLDRHGYDAYLDGAALADASTDPSVMATIGSLREQGFLAPTGVEAPVTGQVFRISRDG